MAAEQPTQPLAYLVEILTNRLPQPDRHELLIAPIFDRTGRFSLVYIIAGQGEECVYDVINRANIRANEVLGNLAREQDHQAAQTLAANLLPLLSGYSEAKILQQASLQEYQDDWLEADGTLTPKNIRPQFHVIILETSPFDESSRRPHDLAEAVIEAVDKSREQLISFSVNIINLQQEELPHVRSVRIIFHKGDATQYRTIESTDAFRHARQEMGPVTFSRPQP